MRETPETAYRHTFDLCSVSPFANDVVAMAQEPGRPPLLMDEQLIAKVDGVRDQLEALKDSPHPDDQRVIQLMNANFLEYDAPFLPAFYRNPDYGLMINPTQVLLSITALDVIKILTWHAKRQERRQERLLQEVPGLTERALLGVDRVIDLGLLPARARLLAERALKETTFLAMDSFEAAYLICEGYYQLGDFVMGLSHIHTGGSDGFGTLRPDVDTLFLHETGHAIHAKSQGGLRSIFSSNTLPMGAFGWCNEIWTEHWAQVAHGGEPDILAPSARNNLNHDSKGYYAIWRELGSKIMTELDEPIPFELIGEAYIEPIHDPRQTARRELDKRVRRASVGIADLCIGDDNIFDTITRSTAGLPRHKRDAKAVEWLKRIGKATGNPWEDETPSQTPVITTRPASTDQ